MCLDEFCPRTFDHLERLMIGPGNQIGLQVGEILSPLPLQCR